MRRMKKNYFIIYIAFFSSILFIIPFQAMGNAENVEFTDEEVWKISDFPSGHISEISADWNPHLKSFIMVGGSDSDGAAPEHTRFIIITDGKEIDKIEDYNNPDYGGQQRYTDVAVCPTKNYALITRIDGSFWKLEGTELTEIETNATYGLYEMIWEPNGDYALIGGKNNILRYEDGKIRDIDTGGHGFVSASWSPNGDYVLLVGAYKNMIGHYDGNSYKTLSINTSDKDDMSIHSVSFSPISEYAIISAQDSSVYSLNYILIGFNGTDFSKIKSSWDTTANMIYWHPSMNLALINTGNNRPIVFMNGSVNDCDVDFNISLRGWSPDGNVKIGIGGNDTIGYGIISWGYLSDKFFPDDDHDGYWNDIDMFPEDPSEWSDIDGDGVGDNKDQFPEDFSEWNDTDEDGVGDNCDAFPNDESEWKDSDGDGYGDNRDIFPYDPTEWNDTDGDRIGDQMDDFPLDVTEWKDTDGDGIGNQKDVFPFDPTEWIDTDSDGMGDNSDRFQFDRNEWNDTDDDGVGDNQDRFPDDPSASIDTDGDGYPDQWNNGKSEVDSTTGLSLDEYPNDPERYEKIQNNFAFSIVLIIIFIITVIIMMFILLVIVKKIIKNNRE